jgi:hypothetical protein
MRLRLRRPPHPHSVARNVAARAEPGLHPSRPEIGFVSSLSSPQPPAVGAEWFAAQLIRGNHENTIRLRLADIDNSQVPTASRPANRYAGAFSPWPIFSRIRQDVLDLFLFHTVMKDVWLTRCRVEVETDMHSSQYKAEKRIDK